jgi:hypothetical protein
MQAPAPPATIDQVIERLNAILDDALRHGHRIGYFAALYERVTTNVRRAVSYRGAAFPAFGAEGCLSR